MVKKGYKQTEIGVVPEDWSVMALRGIADFLGGGTPSKSRSEYWNGDIPWISSSDISLDSIHGLNITRYITGQAVKESATQLCPQNAILIVTRVGVGKIAIAPTKLCTSQDFTNIILRQDNVEYVARALQPVLHDMTNETQGTSIKGITTDEVKNTLIALPPIEEQERIAVVLSETDELIAALEKHIAKKKAIKQGAMQELLTGKRRLPGFSGEWKTFVFGDTFDFIPNNAFTRAQMDDSGKVKNIHYGDILTRFGAYISADSKDIPYIAKEIDLSRFADKCYLQSGDIVIADTAEDETVGKALEVINVECPVLAGQHTLLCRPKVRFAEKFLGYYLNATCYHDQLLPYIVGTKVSSVSKASIAQTKLIVPKFSEQQAIAAILSDMDDEITGLEQKLVKYHQVKQGMMQQLLTGKIRLKNDVVDSAQEEQVAPVNMLPAKPAHNHQFDDAVSIAAIVDAFYSERYPLGRVKVQKLLYLLHRHQAVSVSDFKKKAAGPYADTVRYKGGEPIAMKNRYIASESGKQGTRYSKGDNIAQALDYVEQWGMQADMQWLKENFLYTSRDDLELFATVDMAMCDLNEADIPVSVEAIKNLIASDKEWKAKLSKAFFSDRDIARAIRKCTELFS